MVGKKVEEPDLSVDDETALDTVVSERVKAAGAWPVLANAQAGRQAWARLVAAAQAGGLPEPHRVRATYARRAAELAGKKSQVGRVMQPDVVSDLKGREDA